MPSIPAQCTNPTCQKIFPSGTSVRNSTRIRIIGGGSRCPACGSIGRPAEGLFNATDDTLEVITAPQTTVDMLVALQVLLEKARAGAATPEEVERQAASFGFGFAKLAKSAVTNVGLLALLLSILQFAIDQWDSREDAEFRRQLLESQRQIALLLQDEVPQEPSRNHEQHRTAPAKKKGLPPAIVSKPKPDRGPSSQRPKSQRRTIVKAERRAELKAQRSGFGGARISHQRKGSKED